MPFDTTVKSEQWYFTIANVDFSMVVLLIRRTPTTSERCDVIPHKHSYVAVASSACTFTKLGRYVV